MKPQDIIEVLSRAEQGTASAHKAPNRSWLVLLLLLFGATRQSLSAAQDTTL